jgi:bla regulator protein BlaR1
MDVELLRALIAATVASSVAILLIGLLRRPLRSVIGARAAYWLWLLIPACVMAAWIPAPTRVLELRADSLPGRASSALANLALPAATSPAASIYSTGALGLWAGGATVMLVLLARRQRDFVRSLGDLTPGAGGVRRSRAVVAPMLVGAWRPVIVVPDDFEARYSDEERALVLAHENAHLLRRDGAVNALASVWLCMSWFNPLVYWALGKMRADQELACDALVLADRRDATRRYASALLKTQLSTEPGWRLPVGCQWQSTYPLKERITMLKRPLPGTLRRSMGIAGVCAVTATASFAIWASPSAGDNGPEILVTLKLTVEDPSLQDMHVAATQYIVHSGEMPPGLESGRPYAMSCTPYLSGAGKGAHVQKGQILIECRVRRNGAVVFTPSVVTHDGLAATLTFLGGDGKPKYSLEVLASTAPQDIEAAAKAAARND